MCPFPKPLKPSFLNPSETSSTTMGASYRASNMILRDHGSDLLLSPFITETRIQLSNQSTLMIVWRQQLSLFQGCSHRGVHDSVFFSFHEKILNQSKVSCFQWFPPHQIQRTKSLSNVWNPNKKFFFVFPFSKTNLSSIVLACGGSIHCFFFLSQQLFALILNVQLKTGQKSRVQEPQDCK